MKKDTYASFAELAKAHVEGEDYVVTARPVRGARVLIVAPHAGKIEFRTSEIAKAIAGVDHSLYLFEGIMEDRNWELLHITSHRFDEPECADLLGKHAVVISIHGCGNIGSADAIYVGGRDDQGKERIAEALRQSWFDARTSDHPFPGTEPGNVCNRGTTGAGIQLELSRGVRIGLDLERFSRAVRTGLQACLG